MTKISHLAFDVHAATLMLGLLDEGQKEAEVWEIANDPATIRKTVQRLRKGRELRCCYEAGACGYVLHRQLTGMGIPCDVVAPSLIPKKPGERVKTDRRDAAKLARLHRAGELTPIGVPTEDQEAVRDLVRAREDARRARTDARHRLSKFLLRQGQRFASNNWTHKFWKWVKGLTFTRPEHAKVFSHYVDMVLHLDRQIEDLEKHIDAIAEREPFKTTVGKLRCLRGVDTLSAMVVVSEVYDLRRFPTAREFMAFLGLVPSEHSSGPKQRRGGITKTGNGHVRRILVEAAWAYRHHPGLSSRVRKLLTHQAAGVADLCRKADLRLTRRFRRLTSRGKPNQVAMTAVARELAGFIWAMARVPAA